eukprot:CAMPEP_0114994432 /NCGR_PEP_ID=MMETSP0216-20121206/13130_1 /TAXON_ID=223996 /ORGANISM="Protocruzia adherens, Strain Boccale" /LENGTH=244 /DNA_ID=CAMNT_0002358281 /DNA_START=471 /DNA_END=1205 /DNA_ORIENTATION=-
MTTSKVEDQPIFCAAAFGLGRFVQHWSMRGLRIPELTISVGSEFKIFTNVRTIRSMDVQEGTKYFDDLVSNTLAFGKLGESELEATLKAQMPSEECFVDRFEGLEQVVVSENVSAPEVVLAGVTCHGEGNCNISKLQGLRKAIMHNEMIWQDMLNEDQRDHLKAIPEELKQKITLKASVTLAPSESLHYYWKNWKFPVQCPSDKRLEDSSVSSEEYYQSFLALVRRYSPQLRGFHIGVTFAEKY